jgi:transcriptional regulator GlxA family with amidase domain
MSNMGVRTWGNSPDGETVLLTGTYQLRSEISRRLLGALPPLLVVTGDTWENPLIPYLAEEIVKDEPGQEAVLDRLLDLVLIAVLRAWFARPEAGAPGWYRAHGDPIVGPALQLLHNTPAHPWTVARLASATGVSRAALARRFNDLVGEPPMTYLTSWRLSLAADLLERTDLSIDAIARQVGYVSGYSLSVAFKRVLGLRPGEHRATHRAA